MWNLVLVVVCLLVFFSVNLYNVLRYHRGSPKTAQPEVPWPNSVIMGVTTIGTFMFFLDSILYLLLGVFGWPFSTLTILDVVALDFLPMRLVGALVMTVGYVVFVWSVITRGRYATSWTMSAQHKLVDWGPYRFVRHPSYLGYFLMFIGFCFMWPNLFTLLPLIAIPGYVLATSQEELMLVKRFGEEYSSYSRRVGRFVPKLRFWNRTQEN